jgi:hypothetical protein
VVVAIIVLGLALRRPRRPLPVKSNAGERA